jgi:hypothetical protein
MKLIKINNVSPNHFKTDTQQMTVYYSAQVYDLYQQIIDRNK